MVVVAGRKVSSVLLFFVAAVLGAGMCLFALNYWHTLNCATSQSAEETANLIQALNRRLLEAESEVLRNEILMNKVINAMQNNLARLEAKEHEELSRESKDEAVRIALFLATHPAPPMPNFVMESEFEDAEKLADVIDDIFGKGDAGKFEEGTGEIMEAEAEITLTDAEATKICTEWKDTYKVIVGVSWGDLPYDLQQKWVEYSCDYHMKEDEFRNADPDPLDKDPNEMGEPERDPLISF